MAIKNCVVCGRFFNNRHPGSATRQTCSKAHQLEQKRRMSRKYAHVRYTENPAKFRALSRAYAKANPTPKLILERSNCAICGNEFFIGPGYRRRGAKTCCAEHAREYKRVYQAAWEATNPECNKKATQNYRENNRDKVRYANRKDKRNRQAQINREARARIHLKMEQLT